MLLYAAENSVIIRMIGQHRINQDTVAIDNIHSKRRWTDEMYTDKQSENRRARPRYTHLCGIDRVRKIQ